MADDPGGLHAAADRIRETAKWITLSLAGVATVALAGSQLSSVGTLDTSSDRFHDAVTGAIVAGIAAVTALGLTAYVAVSPAATLSRLAKNRPRGSKTARNDASLRGGRPTVAQLQSDYETALSVEQTALTSYYADPNNAALRTAAETASSAATDLNQICAGLTSAASYAIVAFRYKVAAVGLILAASAGGAGLGTFVWAANPPDGSSASSANANVLTAPKTGMLDLNAAGMAALSKDLGTACPTAQSLNVLILGNSATGPDLLVQQPDCTSLRLALTSDWGVVTTNG